MNTYDELWITSLTPEYHERTCNYWYTVTSHSTAHTAFTEAEHLLNWLAERGLTINEPLPERGTYGNVRINGAYSTQAHMNTEEFYALRTMAMTRVMSNAHYTLGLITDDNGHRTVHYLNPNVHERIEFDYTTSRQLVG